MVEFCILVGFMALLGITALIAGLCWRLTPIRTLFYRFIRDLPQMWDETDNVPEDR